MYADIGLQFLHSYLAPIISKVAMFSHHDAECRRDHREMITSVVLAKTKADGPTHTTLINSVKDESSSTLRTTLLLSRLKQSKCRRMPKTRYLAIATRWACSLVI